MDFVEKKNTYRATKTILEMLADRNYIVPDSLKSISFSEFIQMYENNNCDITDIYKKDDPDDQIYIKFFLENKKLGIKDLHNLVETIREETDNNFINILIVTKDKPSTNINKELRLPQYNTVELFQTKDIMVNIMKHDIMPSFRLLNEEEVEPLSTKFNCTKTQFPKIYRIDPAAKYFNMKVGQIYEVIRNSSSTGQYTTYRIVK
jgi:DNA-directed RNA polymerase subunit H (RpoH/RPB5)